MVLGLQMLVIAWITGMRQHIHDKTASRNDWENSYDFIIVGSGAAGCVVAQRLAQTQNASVLLLEAGKGQDAIYNDIPALFMNVTVKRPDLEWMYRFEPQRFAGKSSPNEQILQTSGKALGGSSTHNNMIFSRGSPKDFDNWEHKYGAKGWKFSSVLPYFKRFENNKDPKILKMSPNLHGTDGPLTITTPRNPGDNLFTLRNIYNSLGFWNLDLNGDNQTGTMIGQSFITTHGFRSSTSNSYIDPNSYPQKLHIVTKAFVNKILFEGLTATGVEFTRNDTKYEVYANKEVIISAGGIRSPQLLMLSGIGPKDHLEKFKIPVLLNLPVGDNFKNHPTLLPNRPFAPPLSIKNLRKLYFRHSGPLSKHPFLLICLSTPSNLEKNWPNICIWSILDLEQKIINHIYLARPQSSGIIRFKTTEPESHPLIDPKFFEDDQDYKAMVEGTAFMLKIAAHHLIAANVTNLPSFESVGCPTCPSLPNYKCMKGLKCYIEEVSDSLHHPCCSCRMGALHRNDVVVGPDLRVKGAQHLRVCDASIMPDIPMGNLYAPSVMIGEKCAQTIIDFYRL